MTTKKATSESKDGSLEVGQVAWEGTTPVLIAAVNDDGSYVVGRFVVYETHHGTLTPERPS